MKTSKQIRKRVIRKYYRKPVKLPLKLILTIILIGILYILIPNVLAQGEDKYAYLHYFPKAENKEYVGVVREVTMYNSLEDQTDNSPCIAAWGENICESKDNVCATNAFPRNTVLEIKGLGTCIVKDRMNSRYKERIDWYAGMDKDRAIKFGIKNLIVKVK